MSFSHHSKVQMVIIRIHQKMMIYNWLTIVLIDIIIIIIIIISNFTNSYELWWRKDISLQRAQNHALPLYRNYRAYIHIWYFCSRYHIFLCRQLKVTFLLYYICLTRYSYQSKSLLIEGGGGSHISSSKPAYLEEEKTWQLWEIWHLNITWTLQMQLYVWIHLLFKNIEYTYEFMFNKIGGVNFDR